MTQIVLPTTDILRTHDAREAVDALLIALEAAEAIPTTDDGFSPISGQRYARYGGLIRIECERRTSDVRGPATDPTLVSHVLPADADRVLVRLLTEGRRIHSVTAVRGALGGTVRV